MLCDFYHNKIFLKKEKVKTLWEITNKLSKRSERWWVEQRTVSKIHVLIDTLFKTTQQPQMQ